MKGSVSRSVPEPHVGSVVSRVSDPQIGGRSKTADASFRLSLQHVISKILVTSHWTAGRRQSVIVGLFARHIAAANIRVCRGCLRLRACLSWRIPFLIRHSGVEHHDVGCLGLGPRDLSGNVGVLALEGQIRLLPNVPRLDGRVLATTTAVVDEGAELLTSY